jgi:hypothetical protein
LYPLIVPCRAYGLADDGDGWVALAMLRRSFYLFLRRAVVCMLLLWLLLLDIAAWYCCCHWDDVSFEIMLLTAHFLYLFIIYHHPFLLISAGAVRTAAAFSHALVLSAAGTSAQRGQNARAYVSGVRF